MLGIENRQMDIRQEIAEQIEELPPETQTQALRFAAPAGEKGVNLRQFASTIDSVSARQMIRAIDEECEQLDDGDW